MEPQDSVYEEKKIFRHVMVQKIPFFEKLTIFFPFFCPFFPFGGGYSTSLTLHVIELVMTFRMIGHMTNNQIYFYTKKHFEIMYYRFLQFLAFMGYPHDFSTSYFFYKLCPNAIKNNCTYVQNFF